jgi:hypothetical protein
MKAKFYQILSSITFKVYAQGKIPGARSQEPGGRSQKLRYRVQGIRYRELCGSFSVVYPVPCTLYLVPAFSEF